MFPKKCPRNTRFRLSRLPMVKSLVTISALKFTRWNPSRFDIPQGNESCQHKTPPLPPFPLRPCICFSLGPDGPQPPWWRQIYPPICPLISDGGLFIHRIPCAGRPCGLVTLPPSGITGGVFACKSRGWIATYCRKSHGADLTKWNA